eukprot:gene8969-2255_t
MADRRKAAEALALWCIKTVGIDGARIFGLAEGAIHNRFDKNAVNDVDSKRTLQKKIEADYEKYSKDAAMLLAGTGTPERDWVGFLSFYSVISGLSFEDGASGVIQYLRRTV